AYLDGLPAKGTTDLNATLRAYAENGRPSGLVVVISDLLAPGGYRAGLERLRAARLEVVVLQILSPQEFDPSAEGDVELVDRETGEMVEGPLTEGIVEQYRRRLERWLGEIEQPCNELAIRYPRLSTATSIEAAVLSELRGRRILR